MITTGDRCLTITPLQAVLIACELGAGRRMLGERSHTGGIVLPPFAVRGPTALGCRMRSVPKRETAGLPKPSSERDQNESVSCFWMFAACAGLPILLFYKQ